MRETTTANQVMANDSRDQRDNGEWTDAGYKAKVQEHFADDNLYRTVESRVYTYEESRPYRELQLTVGGDYIGSTLEKANYKWLNEHDDFGKFVCPMHYDFDTHAAAFDVADLLTITDPDERIEVIEMIEAIDSLLDYPCFDDESISMLEMDIEYEYIQDDIAPDLQRHLEGIIEDHAEWTDQDETNGFMPDLDSLLNDDTLIELVYKAMEQQNEHCIFETGGTPYIDTDKVFAWFDGKACLQLMVEANQNRLNAAPLALPIPDYQLRLPFESKPYHAATV